MTTSTALLRHLESLNLNELAYKAFRKLIYQKRTLVLLKYDLNKKRKRFRSSQRWTTRAFLPTDLQYCREHFTLTLQKLGR